MAETQCGSVHESPVGAAGLALKFIEISIIGPNRIRDSKP